MRGAPTERHPSQGQSQPGHRAVSQEMALVIGDHLGGLLSSSMWTAPDRSAGRMIWGRHRLSLPALPWHSRVRSKQGQGGSACSQKSHPTLRPGLTIKGETQKSAEGCILSRSPPLCCETREQRVATAWWGGGTRSCCPRVGRRGAWEGGAGGLLYPRHPPACCMVSHLLC